jgi:hypothetical protein
MTKQLTRNCLSFSISVLLLIPCAVLSKERRPAKNQEKINLRIEVTAGEEAEPVSGTDVIVRTVSGDTPFEKTLQTNKSGVVTFKGVPRVRIKILVTADGCRTFGQFYNLDEEGETITITLQKKNDGGG